MTKPSVKSTKKKNSKENVDTREKILADYPKLYEECYDFSPSVGWLSLIREMSERLKDTNVKVVQVKSKFGGLRYYVNGTTSENYLIITKAETASYHICEDCGEPGTTRPGGWVMTLCDSCYEKTQQKANNS